MPPARASESDGDPRASISAVILTYNSAASIARTLGAVRGLTTDIYIVDSFSTDETLDICRTAGCQVHQRPFLNYADQRNWAIDNLDLQGEWQIHLDADEELGAGAAETIRAAVVGAQEADGFILCRKLVFLGRVLRFGGIARTWHCRVFRRGAGRCEDRLYDQHFLCSGPTRVLDATIFDHQEASLADWTASHNRWADFEAAELLAQSGPMPRSHQIQARLAGNVIERRRYHKARYYQMPLFLRPLLYFLVRYVFQLGLLDGRPGLIYHVLQGFWFRFLVDAKVFEARRALRQP